MSQMWKQNANSQALQFGGETEDRVKQPLSLQEKVSSLIREDGRNTFGLETKM